jgi:hypothetical protein
MAFIVAYASESDGLELSRMILSHKSKNMSLMYLSQFNKNIKKAIDDLELIQSNEISELIIKEVQNNKKLYNKNGNNIYKNYMFKGSYIDELSDYLNFEFKKSIDSGKLVILQTPISFCFHDFSNKDRMACQRDLDLENFFGENVYPSRCRALDCPNAVFTEEQIDKINYISLEAELYDRLKSNKLFIEANGFNLKKIIPKNT